MKKITSKKSAQAATGIAIIALLAGQWALITGPLDELAEQGREAIEVSNMTDFAIYAGLHTLATAAMPLIFGAIGICVIATYEVFNRMQNNRTTLVTLINDEHREKP